MDKLKNIKESAASQSLSSDSVTVLRSNESIDSMGHNLDSESTSTTNVTITNCSFSNNSNYEMNKKNEQNRQYLKGNVVVASIFMPDSPSFSSSSISSTSTFSPATMAESSTTNGAVKSVAYKKYSRERRRSRRKSEGIESESMSLGSTSSLTPATFNEGFLRMLDSIFYNIGLFVSDHAISILTVIFIITAICSLKIPFTPQQDDIKTGYTPNGAQSHVEAMLYDKFYRNITSSTNTTAISTEINDPISIVVFVAAKDGGSMLRETHLNETVWVVDELATKFRLAGKTFYEFCTDFCQFNEPIRQFKNGFILSNRQYNHLPDLNKSKLTNEINEFSANRINLTFPFISILGFKFDMSPHFFGVQKFSLDDNVEKELAGESVIQRQRKEFGLNMKFMKLIVLQFRAEKPVGATKDDVSKWERRLANYILKDLDAQYVQPYMLSVTVVGDEIVRTGMTLFPYITVGFAIMSVFSIVTVYLSGFYYDQWTTHKVSLALWACICPLLATSSALGFLFLFGFRFGTILAVSPFLIMAIGVDDAYLMIHSWQRICAERVRTKRLMLYQSQLTHNRGVVKTANVFQNEKKNNEDLRERIAEVLVDIGPSITITSLTNVFAFIIGIFSPTPEIQLFCAGNATAIFFDYVYQLFMFTPIIAIVGRFEIKLEQLKISKEKTAVENQLKRNALRPLPSAEQLNNRQALESNLTRFMSRYCQWLANGFTTVLVFLILLIYWSVSIKGALNINVNITPKKLFLSDSFINEINLLRDNYILPNYTATSVFVNNVGNLSDPARVLRIRQLIADYEAMPNCMGKIFTHFWLRDFDNYIENMNEDEEEELTVEIKKNLTGLQTIPIEEMRGFLNWPEYKHWGGFMRFNENNERLEKFFAVIAYQGSDLVEWHRRSQLLSTWREIAKNYSDLEAWVYADDAQFLDQIDTLVPATIQSSVATLFCMVIVCGLFMSNIFTVVVATLSIVSICIGVFGFLAHWSIDLDPISMATTIMSIGFSVDFPAHVTYHYYRGGIDNEMNLRPEERIYQSLIAIGFPLLQCGLSTILFVLCLLFVDTYMSEVFVKTMIMVVSLGVLHGLFVVPTFLCALSNIYKFMCITQKKLHYAVRNLGDITNIINSTKPAIKIKRQLSKKNIAKISVSEMLPA